jgi:hypothetical protein
MGRFQCEWGEAGEQEQAQDHEQEVFGVSWSPFGYGWLCLIRRQLAARNPELDLAGFGLDLLTQLIGQGKQAGQWKLREVALVQFGFGFAELISERVDLLGVSLEVFVLELLQIHSSKVGNVELMLATPLEQEF